MRLLALVGAVAFATFPLCVLAQDQAELPTKWEPPPVDVLEEMAAGYAEVLCSNVFLSGRDPERVEREDGFRVAPAHKRNDLGTVAIDRTNNSVSVTLPTGVARTAKIFGGQGCVTLPRGAESISFTPEPVISALPDPAAMDWPMGDRLPDEAWPQELDKAKIDEVVDTAFGNPQATFTSAFVIAYKGRIIAERYEEGADLHTPMPGWSMGKSINATLMGQLINEGVYDLWAPAPVDEWKNPDDPRHAIRIADLLRMSSGLRFVSPEDPDYDAARGYADHLYIYTGAIDVFRWSTTRPPQWPPNTVGRYRNSDPLTIAYLIRKAVEARGEDYLTYPQRHLFDKLGMRDTILETDPFGNFIIAGYDLAPARDWVRLGLLYLQGGMWNGERILPEGWTDFVRTPAPAWSKPVYGGSFWLNRTLEFSLPKDAYSMQGSGGQYTFIIPTHDLVVVRMGHDKGGGPGWKALALALLKLTSAMPQAREPWTPPPDAK
jgi:CubicO group peptidase (beta-lactamase class C family)